MYGKIETYRRDIGVGIISAENGRKYRFKQQNLINPRLSLDGDDVDFELDGPSPTAIIVLAGSPWSVFSGIPATPLFASVTPARDPSRIAA